MVTRRCGLSSDMKHLLKIAILLLLPAACFAGPGFVIKGNVSGIVSGSIAITESHQWRTDGKEVPLPPKVRIENGRFTFTGELAHPMLVTLKVSTREFVVYLENTSYTVTGRLDALSGASFKGGPLNDEYQAYAASGIAPMDYIKAHPNSEIAAWLALGQSTGMISEAMAAYNLLGATALNTWPGKELTATIEAFKKSAPGTVFPDLKLTDAKGKALTMKMLKGKIVVLDFWASWCGPCRAYIPTLREHYNQYQPKGVQFVSVSVDADKEKWTDAMAELKMEWTQVLADGAFEDGKGIKELLHIFYIPHVIIVGKDGKIAASLDYSRKNQLDKKLDELLQ